MKPKCLQTLDWIKQDELWGIDDWWDVPDAWYLLNATPEDGFILLGHPTEVKFMPGEIIFAAPLYLERQGERTLLFNQGIHGYNGELDQEPVEPEKGDVLSPWCISRDAALDLR
ncbi:MAG: hypothetical protein AAGI37_15830 [Planctomycetota bacterium]